MNKNQMLFDQDTAYSNLISFISLKIAIRM